MPKPSPDLDLVTLKWAGTYLDGSPAQGALNITYSGGVMLDDDLVTPMNIFPKTIAVPLTTLKVEIDGEMKDVGYAEIQVPATNDPDISGGGGTYSLTEDLKGVSSGRKNMPFVVDHNAPNGVMWLNKIMPTTPNPGQPIQIVYWNDFQSLKSRVTTLEQGGGGGTGGPVSWDAITNKPTTFTPTTGTTASTAAAGNDARLSDDRNPLAHSHQISDVSGLQTALDSKQGTGNYVTASELASGLSPKADATDVATALNSKADSVHGHAISDVSGLQSALDAASGGGGSPSWDNVTDKPTAFPPSAHQHPSSEITGLAAVATSGNYSDLAGSPTIPTTPQEVGAQPSGSYVETSDPRLSDDRSPTQHSHPISDVTGLQTALDGKQPSGTYVTSSELASGLSGKSPTSHSHAVSDVTGLQAALNAKGTSNLSLGPLSSNAKPGDYAPPIADMPAGATFTVNYSGGAWPSRPTNRSDVSVFWLGGTENDPPTDGMASKDVWIRDAL